MGTDLRTARSIHALTLGDIAENNARRFGDATAVEDEDSVWTHAGLAQQAGELAAGLAARGVARGDVVAWTGGNSAWLPVALLAAGRLGAALAPLHAKSTDAEREDQLAQLGPRVVLDGPGAAAALCDGRTPPEDQALEDEPVLVIGTGAFDGRQRWAQLTHRGLILQSLLLSARDQLSPREVYLASGPLAHVGTFQYVLAHWLVGARTVVLPRMEPKQFAELVDRLGVTGAYLVPASVPQIVAAAEERGLKLSTLRTPALSGSEILDRWTAMTSRPVWAGESLGTSTGYGQTEVTGLVTSVALGTGAPVGNVGWPQHVAPVRVVRPGTLEEADPGEVGEVVVRGPLVMAGYRGDDMTRRWEGGWHHTTDLGVREADGSLSFAGTSTNMVKSGGENVYPAEVERILLGHEGVRAVCVVGVEDAQWGSRIAAAVAGEVTEAALEEFARERLASHKRPRLWEVVDELPKSAGRVDRAAVAKLFTNGG
ncbi:long-chain acyl-CoA synthetase [Amycolatopsis bartoniae]|uniref:Long-chain acyl-CoA synthetase n=1 Tax=Amycolatopsis bartoniae TaxID=941986 RepID=A0A8H9IMM8_9PSEU|nr:AMP-binding protein [Amycolatopsis bartoniae]MBB2939942.1 long-chain acyl-CoA synthetase [Amycolatopsis bartoniae]GHF35570.1 long-chain acyl-CoA synthetase [Amycolatopsis bartoniae]